MVDTVRTLSALQTLLADNTDGDISAQDMRDVLVSGLPMGTSFPGSPQTNQPFYRSDRNLLYSYDGTRWLCVCPHTLSGTQQNLTPTSTTGSTVQRWPIPQENGGIYLERLQVVTFVATTNNGSNFWTYTWARRNAANTNTDIGTFNTSGDTVNNWVDHEIAADVALAPGDALTSLLTLATTGSPGTAYALTSMEYRLIG